MNNIADDLHNAYNEGVNDGIRQLACKLKEKYSKRKLGLWNCEKAFIEHIDSLVKEMTEASE